MKSGTVLLEIRLFLAPYCAVTAGISEQNNEYCLHTVIVVRAEFQYIEKNLPNSADVLNFVCIYTIFFF